MIVLPPKKEEEQLLDVQQGNISALFPGFRVELRENTLVAVAAGHVSARF